jgi:hypothetical protein
MATWDIYFASTDGTHYSVGALGSMGDTVTDSSGHEPLAGAPDDSQVLDTTLSNSTVEYVGSATFGGVEGFFVDAGGGNIFFYVPAGTPTADATGSVIAISSLGTDNWLLCFGAGTMIATPEGDRAVETLSTGDMVLTAEGATKPVRWLGRSTRSRAFADPTRVYPIRIKAGALGENLPVRDLLVSPGHAVLLDGVLVQAAALVNGTSVVRETAMPETFTYYHVELDSHELLVAEGVATESFLMGVEDMGFDNLAARPAGTVASAEMAYPRVKAARQVPASVRELIATRAAAIAPEFAVAA